MTNGASAPFLLYMPRRVLPDQTKEKVIQAFLRDPVQRKEHIAATYGLHPATVRRYIRQFKFQNPHRQFPHGNARW